MEKNRLNGRTTGINNRLILAMRANSPVPFTVVMDRTVSISRRQRAAPIDVQRAVRSTIDLKG